MSKKRNQQRTSRGYHRRLVGVRELVKRFLIVCEGEKTEPNYFRSFRVPKEIIDIQGRGENTLDLVRSAIEIRNQGSYDQVWCVFDRDSFPAQNFNNALYLAQQHDIRVAYSNEAFEIWYLLHFHYYHTALARRDYYVKLSELLGHSYKKNSDTIYMELESLQQNAIEHAKRLLDEYSPPDPCHDNPSTTVHLLVEELNKYIR
jgi:hypothetical protein